MPITDRFVSHDKENIQAQKKPSFDGLLLLC